MVSAFRTIVANEGMGALATGFGPTAVGYFVQGWFKFGGVEFFKVRKNRFWLPLLPILGRLHVL